MRIRPDGVYTSIYELPLRALWESGLRALLFDLDNTLVPWDGCDLSARLPGFIKCARDIGFALLILSNGKEARVAAMARRLDISYISEARKPLSFGYRAAIGKLRLPPGQCAMVGDQLITDMIGGARVGMRTLLVNPISAKEFFGTRINRAIERVVMRLLGIRRPT